MPIMKWLATVSSCSRTGGTSAVRMCCIVRDCLSCLGGLSGEDDSAGGGQDDSGGVEVDEIARGCAHLLRSSEATQRHLVHAGLEVLVERDAGGCSHPLERAPHQGCVDGAGTQCVNPHAGGVFLPSESADSSDRSKLCRAVGDVAAFGDETRLRRQDDHGTGTAGS